MEGVTLTVAVALTVFVTIGELDGLAVLELDSVGPEVAESVAVADTVAHGEEEEEEVRESRVEAEEEEVNEVDTEAEGEVREDPEKETDEVTDVV